MRVKRIAVGVTCLVVLAACNADGRESDGFVRSQLELVPQDVVDGGGFQLWTTDLARAASLMSLDAPGPGRPARDVEAWSSAFVTGSDTAPGLAVFVPEIPVGTETVWRHASDIATSTGIDLGAIEQVVSLAAGPPSWFTVTTGELAIDPSLPTVAPGVRSYGDGDDFAVAPTASSWWMGWPVRLAARDHSIAWSPTTPVLESWGRGATLADAPDIAAVAEQLDARGSVSATIAVGDFGPMPDPRDSPAEAEAYVASIPDVAPFGTVGIGVAIADDGPRSIVTYVFGSNADAAAAVAPLSAAWRDSEDRSGRPVRDRCRLVDARSEGHTVVVELAPTGDATTLAAAAFLFGLRDVVFTHP